MAGIGCGLAPADAVYHRLEPDRHALARCAWGHRTALAGARPIAKPQSDRSDPIQRSTIFAKLSVFPQNALPLKLQSQPIHPHGINNIAPTYTQKLDIA